MKKFLMDLVVWWTDPKKTKSNLWTIAATVVFLTTIIVVTIIFRNDQEPSPCSPGRFPRSCYHIEERICNSAWAAAEAKCLGTIKGLGLPPTRLYGPILKKCQALQMYRSFRYLKVSSPECNQMNESVLEWSKSNPDF